MTIDEIMTLAEQCGLSADRDSVLAFAGLVAAGERAACERLHDHEDVEAPVGHSVWGEAYQDGWAAGTMAYRDAIRARSA